MSRGDGFARLVKCCRAASMSCTWSPTYFVAPCSRSTTPLASRHAPPKTSPTGSPRRSTCSLALGACLAVGLVLDLGLGQPVLELPLAPIDPSGVSLRRFDVPSPESSLGAGVDR